MKSLLLFLIAAVAYAQAPGGISLGGSTGRPNAKGTLAADGTVIDISHTFSVDAAAAALIDCYTVAGVKIPGTTPTITVTHPNATTIRVTFSASQTAGAYCNANATGTGSAGPAGAAGTGDVLGASSLTTADRLTYVASSGALSQFGSVMRTGGGATERLKIANSSGASGLDLQIGSSQGINFIQRTLAADGTTLLNGIAANGAMVNSVAVSVFTGATENAALDPTRGLVAGANRGLCWGSTNNWYSTSDTCWERPSAGTIRATVGLTGARASVEALNATLTGNLSAATASGAFIGTSVQPYSANLTGFAGKTAPTGDVVGTLGAQSLFAKTMESSILVTPTVAATDWTNANHNHTSADRGGQLTDAALSAPVSASKGGTGLAGTLTGVAVMNGTSPMTIVTGTATNCVLVNGTSATCGTGGGSPIVEVDAGTVGQEPRINFQAGTAISLSSSNEAGTRNNVSIAANTAVLQTRANDLGNGDRLVTLSSSGTDTFVGTTGLSFAAYPTTKGMQTILPANAACSGANTLALNGLAAKNNYEADGTTNMTCASGDVITLIWDPALNAGAGGWRKTSGSGGATVTATNTTGPFASLGTCDSTKANQVYHFDDSAYYTHAICDGTSTWKYYFRGKRVYPPVLGDFTAMGTGGTGTTITGYVHFVGDTDAGNQITGYEKATPGSTYSIIAAFQFLGGTHTLANCGVGWKRSDDSDNLHAYQYMGSYISQAGLSSQTALSGTGWGSVTPSENAAIGATPQIGFDVIWIKLDDNNTNRQISWSRNGVRWNLWHTEATAGGSFAAEPEEVFFGCNARTSTAVAPYMALISWQEGATTQ